MSALSSPGKGRTLTYSERRAIRDAGDSAYRWFEELVYNDRRTINLPLPTARLIQAGTWAFLAAAVSVTMLTAAVVSDPLSISYLAAAIAAPASLIPSRHGWNRTGIENLAPASWAWPTMTALAGNLTPWSLAASAAIVVAPVSWWPPLGASALAGTVGAGTTGYAPIPVAAVAVTALIALKVAPPNPPGPGMPTGPINLLASWIRPPLNTNRLHKPLPGRTLPWFLYAMNPEVRRIVAEARKNRSDQRSPIPDEWTTKIVGSVGERTTAMHLLGLPRNGYIQAHDIQVPVDEATTANIDHVILGANGLWIVDAKQYRGTLSATTASVHHGSTNLAPMLRTLAWEAASLSAALGSPVKALVLVPANCTEPIEVTVPAQRNAAATTIGIVTTEHLQDWLAAQDPTVYTGVERLKIAAKLATTTSSATTARMPHLTVSRGSSYRTSTSHSLATVATTLAPEYR